MSAVSNVSGATGPGTVTGPRSDGSGMSLSIIDAGLCSKVGKQLPALVQFFRQTKTTISGLSKQQNKAATVIANIQRTQADFNNQASFFSFWYRQLSPQLDATEASIQQANERIEMINDTVKNQASPPGIPSALTLLPGPDVKLATLYFLPPSFGGQAQVTGFDVRIFDSIPNALAQNPISTKATLSSTAQKYSDLAGAVEDEAHPFYALYGDALWSATVATDADVSTFCVTVRATTDAYMNGSQIVGAWSAPSIMCTTATTTLPAPVVTMATPGLRFTLVNWKQPTVSQADGSLAPWANIVAWTVNNCNVTGGSKTLVSAPTSQLTSGGAKLIVTGFSDLAWTSPITSASAPFPYKIISALPAPSIRVTVNGTTAIVRCWMQNYYDPEPLTYRLLVRNLTTKAAPTYPAGHATSPDFAKSGEVGVRIPVEIVRPNLANGNTYMFAVCVVDAAINISTFCKEVGPFQINGTLASSSTKTAGGNTPMQVAVSDVAVSDNGEALVNWEVQPTAGSGSSGSRLRMLGMTGPSGETIECTVVATNEDYDPNSDLNGTADTTNRKMVTQSTTPIIFTGLTPNKRWVFQASIKVTYANNEEVTFDSESTHETTAPAINQNPYKFQWTKSLESPVVGQSTTLTLFVTDSANNAAEGVSITFSVAGAGASINRVSGTTAADGKVMVLLTSNTIGNKSVIAASNTTLAWETVTFASAALPPPDAPDVPNEPFELLSTYIGATDSADLINIPVNTRTFKLTFNGSPNSTDTDSCFLQKIEHGIPTGDRIRLSIVPDGLYSLRLTVDPIFNSLIPESRYKVVFSASEQVSNETVASSFDFFTANGRLYLIQADVSQDRTSFEVWFALAGDEGAHFELSSPQDPAESFRIMRYQNSTDRNVNLSLPLDDFTCEISASQRSFYLTSPNWRCGLYYIDVTTGATEPGIRSTDGEFITQQIVAPATTLPKSSIDEIYVPFTLRSAAPNHTIETFNVDLFAPISMTFNGPIGVYSFELHKETDLTTVIPGAVYDLDNSVDHAGTLTMSFVAPLEQNSRYRITATVNGVDETKIWYPLYPIQYQPITLQWFFTTRQSASDFGIWPSVFIAKSSLEREIAGMPGSNEFITLVTVNFTYWEGGLEVVPQPTIDLNPITVDAFQLVPVGGGQNYSQSSFDLQTTLSNILTANVSDVPPGDYNVIINSGMTGFQATVNGAAEREFIHNSDAPVIAGQVTVPFHVIEMTHDMLQANNNITFYMRCNAVPNGATTTAYARIEADENANPIPIGPSPYIMQSEGEPNTIRYTFYHSVFSPDTTYRLFVTVGQNGSAAPALERSWLFTTEAVFALSATSPTTVPTDYGDGYERRYAFNVPLDISQVSFTYTLAPTYLESAVIISGGVYEVASSASIVGNTAVITINDLPLLPATTYMVNIAADRGPSGNVFDSSGIEFTTVDADLELLSTIPATSGPVREAFDVDTNISSVTFKYNAVVTDIQAWSISIENGRELTISNRPLHDRNHIPIVIDPSELPLAPSTTYVVSLTVSRKFDTSPSNYLTTMKFTTAAV